MPAFIEELSGALRCGLHFLLGRVDWQEVAAILWRPERLSLNGSVSPSMRHRRGGPRPPSFTSDSTLLPTVVTYISNVGPDH